MTELLIHNEWALADGTVVEELTDPATRKSLEQVRCASPTQREQALDAAQNALGSWARRSADERAAMIAAMVDEIRQAAGALAERQAVESGQPLRECQDLVASAIRRWRSTAAPDREQPPGAHQRRLPHQSLWPFWDGILNSIAAGSTLVCELPADRSLTALAIARCAHQLPPGVLNVVTVEPEEASSDAATDFLFVSQDAYLDVAVAGAAALRLYHAGQRRGQSVRIHVEAPMAYRFADRLHEYLAFLEAGDPRKAVTDLGPLYCEAALDRAIEQISATLKRGALVKLGGRPYQPWGLRGYFLQPTLLVEGSGNERAPLEAISAPVVIVSPATDIGTALRETPNPRCLTAFVHPAPVELQKLELSLRDAAFEPRIRAYTPNVDRAWDHAVAAGNGGSTRHPAGALDLEVISAPQLDWFPYKSRRGIKL
ncbi:MAG: aldehyde dehydrogenase [Proteobacteria bacterium]|nr:aldehyde dehydrogenase [Pseudomonadota bacterium]